MLSNWKKSGLQEELEKEGWEWLSNVCTLFDAVRGACIGSIELTDYMARTAPKSDSQLKMEFSSKNFKDIMIADAYDSDGKPINGYRAVYVKRKETNS